MNAVLLTLLASIGGTNGGGYIVSEPGLGHGEASYASMGEECGDCNAGMHRCRHGHCGKGHAPRGGWLGMMPQTCYNPRFGCYDGDRYNHRYPAFHGTYYRRPYNYRNLFDYPWHADLHEPTSNFAYNVNEPSATIVVPPGPGPTPVLPDDGVGPAPGYGPDLPPRSAVPVPVPDTEGVQREGNSPTEARPVSFLRRKLGK